MKRAIALYVLLAAVMMSCTSDYVCVCEVETEWGPLPEATHYPNLRKGEAEIVEEECEERSICTWEEDQ